MKIALDNIIDVMKSKGFRVFEGNSGSGAYYDYDLNIVGIRSSSITSDLWDDTYNIFYRLNKEWKHHIFTCTTDPGRAELVDPSFPAAKTGGTLILKDGEQYLSAYTLGYHGTGSWRHQALLQTGIVKGYRDKNRDIYLDMLPESVTSGLFGANHHAASLWSELSNVGRYSAGCQVFQKPKEYYAAVDLWKKSSKIWGNNFTYTLLNEKDFN